MVIRLRILCAILFALLAYFFYSFYTFLNYTIPSHVQSFTNCTVHDSIAVLTGGRNRIQKGVELYSQNILKPILVTGVKSKVAANCIKGMLKAKCLDLNNLRIGYNATNTKENIIEIEAFASLNNLKHITIVTSYYHLPRVYFRLKDSNLNFNFCVPEHNSKINYIASFAEYIKFLVAVADDKTSDWILGYNKYISKILSNYLN